MEKQRLLEFVVSNPTWKHGELSTNVRQPFDVLVRMSALAAKSTA
jgi:hypothetical protein